MFFFQRKCEVEIVRVAFGYIHPVLTLYKYFPVLNNFSVRSVCCVGWGGLWGMFVHPWTAFVFFLLQPSRPGGTARDGEPKASWGSTIAGPQGTQLAAAKSEPLLSGVCLCPFFHFQVLIWLLEIFPPPSFIYIVASIVAYKEERMYEIRIGTLYIVYEPVMYARYKI